MRPNEWVPGADAAALEVGGDFSGGLFEVAGDVDGSDDGHSISSEAQAHERMSMGFHCCNARTE